DSERVPSFVGSLRRHAHEYMTVTRELDRVPDQVREDLTSAAGIGDHEPRRLERIIQEELDVRASDRGGEQGKDVLDAILQIEGRRIEAHLSDLELREIEDVVDDREERGR